VFFSLLSFFCCIIFPLFFSADIAAGRDRNEPRLLVIASFDNLPDFEDAPVYNELGGQYGLWDRFPDDPSQSIRLAYVLRDAQSADYCLKLHYDVDSDKPAYNGFWLKLNSTDLTYYNRLNLYVRGDALEGFTTRFKVELKDFETTASFMLTGVTAEWQRFSIPFSKYWKIKDWSDMNELVIVFDDIFSTPKIGTIYIDDITVTKE
jgi:hypothetical protein